MRIHRGLFAVLLPPLLACSGLLSAFGGPPAAVIDLGPDADPEEAAKALLRRCTALYNAYDPAVAGCYAAEATIYEHYLDEEEDLWLEDRWSGAELHADARDLVEHRKEQGAHFENLETTYTRVGSHRVEIRLVEQDSRRDVTYDTTFVVGLDGAVWRYLSEKSEQRRGSWSAQ